MKCLVELEETFSLSFLALVLVIIVVNIAELGIFAE